MLDNIKYLIKFIPEKQYVESLLDGNLFMRCARYYQRLEMQKGPGQGDLREGSIFPNTMIYKNLDLPIYCMYMVEEDDIVDGYTMIHPNVVEDFGCQAGYLVLIDYIHFCNAIKTINTEGHELKGGKVKYGVASSDTSSYLLIENTVDNLFLKDPYFAHQKEF